MSADPDYTPDSSCVVNRHWKGRCTIRSSLSVLNKAPSVSTLYPRSCVPQSISQHKGYIEVRHILRFVSTAHCFRYYHWRFLIFLFNLMLLVLPVLEQQARRVAVTVRSCQHCLLSLCWQNASFILKDCARRVCCMSSLIACGTSSILGFIGGYLHLHLYWHWHWHWHLIVVSCAHIPDLD